MRPHSALALGAVLATLVAPGGARAGELYDVVGGLGVDPLKAGTVANNAFVNASPNDLAAGPGGELAFTVLERIYWVQGGRIVRSAHEPAESDLVFTPDGSLLVADQFGGVWRYDADGRRSRVAGRSDRRGSSGDGGPAALAALDCPSAIDVQADGGILVADGCAHRIRRIGPDATISTVAGTGRRRGPAGDGGPAAGARVSSPQGVAALPDGGFAILEDEDPPGGQMRAGHNSAETIRQVGPDGSIRTRLRLPTPASDLAAEADGSLLLVLESPTVRTPPVWVQRLRPDGTLEAVAGMRDVASIGPYAACGLCEDAPYAISSAPGGGFLLGAGGIIRYSPPAVESAMLAVAIARATRLLRPHLEVAVRLTRPAGVRVVVAGVRDRAERRLDLPAGETLVPFPELARAGEYEIAVAASTEGRIATDYGRTLVGNLPVSFARTYVSGHYYAAPKCRRTGPLSVECRGPGGGRCKVRTLRLLPDGRLRQSARRLTRRACR